MYKAKDNSEYSFLDFNQPLGLHMNPNNRWIKLADLIPWDEYEERYASRFTSTLGNAAKPCRMALGALIIQKKLGFSDRELVEEIAENPYFQYFIGLPGYQETAPFDVSTLVSFRKRFNVDMSVFMNEKLLEKRKAKEESRKKQTKETKETDQKKDDHHPSDGAGSSGSVTPNSSSEAPASEPPAEDSGDIEASAPAEAAEPANKGTLILDATCAPSYIRFPQDFSLLNEAREDLEQIIIRICRDHGEHRLRTYRKAARKNYLNLAKSKRRSARKIRRVIRKQLGFVKRDIGYIDGYLAKGYELQKKEKKQLDTIRKVYEQQKYMFDNKTHRVEGRVVSISQPYIRPIVRGKVKTPVEFGIKFDLSLDEDGMGRIEKITFDPYNESEVLSKAVESYKARNGHYPERVLADQIYRTRANHVYCKEHKIRISGPKLGRPSGKLSAADKKLEYIDNTDRIEVERSFSLSKRCYGLGLIKTKLEDTSYGAVGLSIFVTNLFRILDREVRLFFAFFKVRLGEANMHLVELMASWESVWLACEIENTN